MKRRLYTLIFTRIGSIHGPWPVNLNRRGSNSAFQSHWTTLIRMRFIWGFLNEEHSLLIQNNPLDRVGAERGGVEVVRCPHESMTPSTPKIFPYPWINFFYAPEMPHSSSTMGKLAPSLCRKNQVSFSTTTSQIKENQKS